MDDERYGFVEAYDCNDRVCEQLPNVSIYQPEFKELEELCDQVTTLLRQPLERTKFENPVKKALLDMISHRVKSKAPKQTKFAVVGDMKSGKSSVINSILGQGTIARKGDSGESCTWVVQRFMRSFEDQDAPFAAKVHFFPIDGIREIMKELLHRYSRAIRKPSKDENEEDAVDDRRDEDPSDTSDAGDVISTLRALFCELEEFHTEDSAKAFLQANLAEDHETLLEHLVEWADELAGNHLGDKEFVYKEAATTAELLWSLQPYTYQIGDMDGDLACPWPLVSSIDFGLPSALLDEGIILVDTPGLSDANRTRRTNAQRHHRECTHKLAVAEIGRAESDLSLRQSLQLGFRLGGPGSVVVILTHGDIIDEGPEVPSFGSPSAKQAFQQETLKLNRLSSERTARCKQQVQHRRLNQYEDEDLAEEIRSISTEIRSITDHIRKMKMDMRNKKVVRRMRTIYQELTQDPKPLAVFAVGNQAYQKHQSGYMHDESPVMSVQETNIPALRACLYELPAEGKLNERLHVVNVQLPSLMNVFEMYCSQAYIQKKGEIESMLSEPKWTMRHQVNGTIDSLKADLERLFLEPMRSHEGDWAQGARQLCRKWALDFPSGKNLPMLRRNGFRKGNGKKQPEINWNLELLELGKPLLEDWFQAVTSATRQRFPALKASIGACTGSMQSQLEVDPRFNLLALRPLLQNISLSKKSLSEIMNECTLVFGKEISDILEKSIYLSDEAYLMSPMLEIYSEVSKIKGARGGPRQRAVALEMRITRPDGPWNKIHDQISTAFDQTLTRFEASLVSGLDSVYDRIRDEFNIICENRVSENAKAKVLEDELREQLRDNIGEARHLLEVPIMEKARVCKAHGKGQSSMFVN